jgi:uncharacterized membrane protein YeaQ/YmgE (transglycosylase-associated protein family)
VGFTVAHVTGGARTIILACLVGLLPVAFFLTGSQLARGLFSAIAMVIVAAYTACWIYGVRQYDGDKVDGLGLFYFLVSALGVAALTPALAGHWLVYIWRDWRARPAVRRPS